MPSRNSPLLQLGSPCHINEACQDGNGLLPCVRHLIRREYGADFCGSKRYREPQEREAIPVLDVKHALEE